MYATDIVFDDDSLPLQMVRYDFGRQVDRRRSRAEGNALASPLSSPFRRNTGGKEGWLGGRKGRKGRARWYIPSHRETPSRSALFAWVLPLHRDLTIGRSTLRFEISKGKKKKEKKKRISRLLPKGSLFLKNLKSTSDPRYLIATTNSSIARGIIRAYRAWNKYPSK